MMWPKQYYIQYNVGKARYVLNISDGVQKHGDGSRFWGIRIFKNQKKLIAYTKYLENNGFTPQY